MIHCTERIRFRDMNSSDINTYNKWSNDIDVIQYTYPFIRTYSIEETVKFYQKIKESVNSETFMIDVIEDNKTIGITSLVKIDKHNLSAEFIIDIGEKEYWGKGFGKEVTISMLHYCFHELDLHRIHLRVFSFNERAISLYKSIGFVEEGRLREAIYRFDRWHDIVNMGMLRDEFLSRF